MLQVSDLLSEYQEAQRAVETSASEIHDAEMSNLSAALDRLVSAPARGVADIVAKLGCLAQYYAGGEVPADDVARVAAELALLI